MTLSEPLVAKRIRKPGRPRKYLGDGIDMPSPLTSAESSFVNKKRGRGRPKGSDQKPVFMESLGNVIFLFYYFCILRHACRPQLYASF